MDERIGKRRRPIVIGDIVLLTLLASISAGFGFLIEYSMQSTLCGVFAGGIFFALATVIALVLSTMRKKGTPSTHE